MIARIVDQKLLYRSERFFSAFPGLALLPSGDVLLGFRRAPDHRWLFGPPDEADLGSVDHWHFRSHIALKRFDAGMCTKGEAWAMPMHPEAGDQDANLFVTSTGQLIQYGFLWYPVPSGTASRLQDEGRSMAPLGEQGVGYVFWGGYTRFSGDEGESWSDYQFLPTDPDHEENAYPLNHRTACLRGRMIELPDGRLMVTGYQGGIIGHERQVGRVFISTDHGAHWEILPTMMKMEDVYLQEPGLASWPPGQLTVFFRTSGVGDQLVTATLDTGGKLIIEPSVVPIQGHPYDPLVLPDGRLFLVYGYRHKPMGVRARIIEPSQKIEEAEELIIRDDSPSRDTGYPSAVLLPDGKVAIAYYIADRVGLRGIEASIVELA